MTFATGAPPADYEIADNVRAKHKMWARFQRMDATIVIISAPIAVDEAWFEGAHSTCLFLLYRAKTFQCSLTFQNNFPVMHRSTHEY